jgi:hypothetical protein
MELYYSYARQDSTISKMTGYWISGGDQHQERARMFPSPPLPDRGSPSLFPVGVRTSFSGSKAAEV